MTIAAALPLGERRGNDKDGFSSLLDKHTDVTIKQDGSEYVRTIGYHGVSSDFEIPTEVVSIDISVARSEYHEALETF